MPKKD